MKKIFWLCVLIFLTGFSCAAAVPPAITLTPEEKAFIKIHPEIRLGVDPKFLPFEFIDTDGEYKGITADYIDLISRATGIKMTVVKGLSWTEAYNKALERDIDVLPAIGKTPEREAFFLFSDPYYHFKRVIVIRNSNTDIKGIEDLFGKTVAVQKFSSHHSYLQLYPKINISLYESVEAALTSVANGTETAFLGNLATTHYLINSTGLTNLKFIAFESEKSQPLFIAGRKDWPELISIINKGLMTINQEQRIAINDKWISVESGVDYGPLIRKLLWAGFFIIAIWVVSLYWILRMKKEIEKRKKIQEDLETAKREAEAANNVKSSFMARMSHEIRTPLNAITGLAYLLKKSEMSLTRKMYIEKIIHASNNMLSIINDILDYSKIEAGKMELESVSFNLDDLLKSVVDIVSYKIEERGIGFELIKDSRVPTWFYGDPKRMEQIFINLVNNAAKFTEDGKVSFEVKLTARSRDECHLVFSITDTGIGMSEDQISNLFEPFTQADPTINRRFGGTGLGLSIVSNLVEMMGGKIKIYSVEGTGTTFVIELVLKIDSVKEETLGKELSAYYFSNIKTLILEKTGANMNTIDSYLRSLGMHCEMTTSEESARIMLETNNREFSRSFDLFIVDYETPEEKGFSYVEKLRRNSRIINMPRVIMLLPIMRDDLFDALERYGKDLGIGKPEIPSILFNGILDIFKEKAFAANKVEDDRDYVREVIIETAGPVNAKNTILLVEDNLVNQMIARSLLEEGGFSVLIAGNGSEGVDLFKENEDKIDLILMDLHMPVMNGYEAADQIRQISKDVPIVAMTADVILGVTQQCRAHGMEHYISKPFDPEKFSETIRSMIVGKIPPTEGKRQLKDRSGVILDREKGLRYLGNNEELYDAVLKEYLKENKETAMILEQAISEKRYSDAAGIVHKIKSSTGSIGATALYSAAVSLGQALKENDEARIAGQKDEFVLMLTELLNLLCGETAVDTGGDSPCQ
ncbi:MAG: transporter substrate-binding domain-containing protein [Synergistaceae bacterium]|nr:transporter substrate-binding domain-containing protein [Synergistaceae bacterium]